MNRISAPAPDNDSFFGRRARHRSETRTPLRPADREEPKLAGAEASTDAEMGEVIDKFERVYAGLAVKETEEVEHPEPLAAVLPDEPASPPHDSEDLVASFRMDVSPVGAQADLTPMRFDLSDGDTVPPIDAPTAGPEIRHIEKHSRRRWPAAIAGVCAALIIGIGVGYMMTPGSKTSVGGAKIESSGHDGTRLRLDYTLPSP
jgi:hypothetical protein